MAKDEHKNDASNQLNLTVVALVALVAIVGLVALVMNAANLKSTQLATGNRLVSADENVAGDARRASVYLTSNYDGGLGGVGKEVQHADVDDSCPESMLGTNYGACNTGGGSGAYDASSGSRSDGSDCMSDAQCKSGFCDKAGSTALPSGNRMGKCRPSPTPLPPTPAPAKTCCTGGSACTNQFNTDKASCQAGGCTWAC